CRIPEPLGELERLSREIRITDRTGQIGGIGHACPGELDENARPELELVVLIDLRKRGFEARTCRVQAFDLTADDAELEQCGPTFWSGAAPIDQPFQEQVRVPEIAGRERVPRPVESALVKDVTTLERGEVDGELGEARSRSRCAARRDARCCS